MASAATASNPNVTPWGQSFTYDGFGNLTNVSVTQGSAPTYSANYNAATNQQTGDCADANGNLNATCAGPNTYDIENRLTVPSGAPIYYAYAPGQQACVAGRQRKHR